MMHATARPFSDPLFVHGFAVLALALGCMPAMQTTAQTLDDTVISETIVGSPIGARTAEDDAIVDDVLAAISATVQMTERVRKTFSVVGVQIEFLDGQHLTRLDEIKVAIDKSQHAINALQTEIDSNALFYNALGAERLEAKDVIAVEFGKGDEVTIYAMRPDR